MQGYHEHLFDHDEVLKCVDPKWEMLNADIYEDGSVKVTGFNGKDWIDADPHIPRRLFVDDADHNHWLQRRLFEALCNNYFTYGPTLQFPPRNKKETRHIAFRFFPRVKQ